MLEAAPLKKKGQILLVDDERWLAVCYREVLLPEGYELVHALNGSEAIEILRRQVPFALILVDYTIAPDTGVEVLGRMLESNAVGLSSTPMAICSNHPSHSPVARKVQQHGYRYVEKPSNVDDCLTAFTSLIHRRESGSDVVFE